MLYIFSTIVFPIKKAGNQKSVCQNDMEDFFVDSVLFAIKNKKTSTPFDADVSRETTGMVLQSFPLFLFSLFHNVAAHGGDVATQFPDDFRQACQFVFHTHQQEPAQYHGKAEVFNETENFRGIHDETPVSLLYNRIQGNGTQAAFHGFHDVAAGRVEHIVGNKQIPMIVTTALTQEQLKEGNVTRQNILSRMKERCYFLTLGNIKRRNKLANKRWSRFRELLDIKDSGGNGGGGGTGGAPTMPNLYEDLVLIGEAEVED